MPRARTHKDVEFHVTWPEGNSRRYQAYKAFDDAAGMAVSRAASTGQTVHIEVLVFSKAGARFVAGDHGVEQYNEDPDASVFDRIVVKAESKGRVA